MREFEPLLPSDEWEAAGVHWHAFAVTGPRRAVMRTGGPVMLRNQPPHAVLRSPWAVALWIDERTQEHVYRRQVWSASEGVWVLIGDEDDLEHLRRENYRIASRGDSIYTDIYSESVHHDLYVEAVTDGQCVHGCAAKNIDG
jgi:hypothetical protein